MTNKPTWGEELDVLFLTSMSTFHRKLQMGAFISTKLAEQRKELIEKVENMDKYSELEADYETGATSMQSDGKDGDYIKTSELINLVKQ